MQDSKEEAAASRTFVGAGKVREVGVVSEWAFVPYIRPCCTNSVLSSLISETTNQHFPASFSGNK